MFFFLVGQLGEFGVEWVFGCEEGFLAVELDRVGAVELAELGAGEASD